MTAMIDSHLFGTLQANDGATYVVQTVQFGLPSPTSQLVAWTEAGNDEFSFSGLPYDFVVNTVRILTQGTTTAAATAAQAALDSAIRAGVVWTVALKGRGSSSTTVRSVSATHDVYIPGRLQYESIYTIVTDPGWRTAAVTDTFHTVANMFGTYDLSAPAGTLPADTSVWLCADQAPAMVGWGLRTSPTSGFSAALNDYSGTAESYTKGGQAAVYSSVTGPMATIGSPGSFDATDFLSPTGRAGMYALIARWSQTDSTPANMLVRGFAYMSGNMSGTGTTVPSSPAVASAVTSSWQVGNLGLVAVPCASIPASYPGVSLFTSQVGVQALCYDSSKAIWLDQTALVPVDQGAVFYTPASALLATQGVLSAAIGTNPVALNLCNEASQFGVSVVGASGQVYGNPRVRPGVTNRFVLVAYTPGNATPTNAQIRIDYSPVYRSPLEV